MKTIHHLVDIDAPPSDVWAALTRQDRMAGWWSTNVDAPDAAAGTLVRWIFTGDFNPVMEIIESKEPNHLLWRCASGHDPWQDSTFSFEIAILEDNRTRLRFWQEYAVELADDYYGTYNFNCVPPDRESRFTPSNLIGPYSVMTPMVREQWAAVNDVSKMLDMAISRRSCFGRTAARQ